MSSRAELVERWQSQLEASESLAETGPDRLRWLRHIRVRLYRFLISCYGDGTWTADFCPTPRPDQSPLIDNTAENTASLPKSTARIRATLKSVRNANDREEQIGPLAAGLCKYDWIRVASFRHLAEANCGCRDLRLQEIEYLQEREGNRHYICVQRLDFDIALATLEAARVTVREARVSQVKLRSASRVVSITAVVLILANMLLLAFLGGVMGSWIRAPERNSSGHGRHPPIVRDKHND